MKRSLDKLTPEELGILFPIELSEHKSIWTKHFLSEKLRIDAVFNNDSIVIEHIGSTAIPGIKAKPIIDILLEVPENLDPVSIISKFKKIRYHFIPRPDKPPPHMMFARGYTLKGYKGQAFHVHIRYTGDKDELLFRDYLIGNPQSAIKYEELKLSLAGKFKNDREAYTEAKTVFITSILTKAKKGETHENSERPVTFRGSRAIQGQ
jgi:GrpB-like predicted nucleotidyltransferase (UPF0157 family)